MTFRASFHFDVKPEWEKDIQEGRKAIDIRINVQPLEPPHGILAFEIENVE